MTAPRLPNLFKVPELKEKILFTLLCLVVYRVGAHIATPGVNVQALADFLRNQGQGTLFSLYDLFAGGSFGRATVFALGIMPYISASIVFQDRKSTRLNSSHMSISYAVFCLKKKKTK